MSDDAASEASTFGAVAKSDDDGAQERDRASRTTACRRRDSNPHTRRHRNLNPACLPIPPLRPSSRANPTIQRLAENGTELREASGLRILRDAFSRLGGVRAGDGGIAGASDRAADQRRHDEHPHLGQRRTAREPGDTERPSGID
jgi:hypothetical protein